MWGGVVGRWYPDVELDAGGAGLYRCVVETMEVNSLTERISVGGTSKLREDVTADQVGAGARVIEGHGLEDSRSKKGGIP